MKVVNGVPFAVAALLRTAMAQPTHSLCKICWTSATRKYLELTKEVSTEVDSTNPLAVFEKRAAASTCSATQVVSHVSIIEKAEATASKWCSSWLANRPHNSSPFTGIALPTGVTNACSCIVAEASASSTTTTLAATTVAAAVASTCAATKVVSHVSIIEKAEPSPSSWCSSWLANRPHTSSPFTGIALPTGVSNACSCLIAEAGASSTSTASSTSATTKSTTKTSTSATTTKKTSSSTSYATTGTPVANTGKRGLAYNDGAYTEYFSLSGQDSQVSWAYNWYLEQDSASFNSALMYIPLLFNNDSTLLAEWPAAAQAGIDNGATHLFSFNEPDWCQSGSACMDVKSSVKTYQEYMQPFAGKAKLGAPAVTNAGAPYGLTWLGEFIGNCTDCTIDFINLHWYSNVYAGATYFEEYVNSARAVADGRPIFITEFALDSTDAYTDAQLQSFLKTVIAWMDQQDDIAGYAYFWDAPGYLVTSDGSSLSTEGQIFNSYVNSTTQANLY